MMLLVQMATTWAMTGIIWFVQLVQYPSFGRVDPGSFAAFHAHHSSAISIIVGPLMIAEAVSAIAFLWMPLRVQTPSQIWLGIGLLGIIWASTFLLQVPAHTRLGEGFDEATWRMLVNSNWVRTLAWSARAALVSHWFYQAMTQSRHLGG